MDYIQTFESYLKSGRAPLYHFTRMGKLDSIISDDILKRGSPSKDKYGRGMSNPEQIKSISLTRNESFSGMYTRIRISLDAVKLINDGYIPYPSDEIGMAMGHSKKGWSNPKSDITRKFLSYTKRTVQHNLKDMAKHNVVKMEYEYEERIYKDIKNIGKYITYIDIDETKVNEDMEKYVKKYPHIIIRKLSYKKITVGDIYVNAPKQGSDVILLDINMINNMEKEKVNQLVD